MTIDPHLSLEDLDATFDTVVVAAPDVQGRLIGRRTTVAGFRQAAAGSGIHVSTCVFGWDIAQDATLLATGALAYTGMHTGMGDIALHPDLATLRPAGWLDRTAICLADAVEGDGTPSPVAPRSLLRAELAAWEFARAGPLGRHRAGVLPLPGHAPPGPQGRLPRAGTDHAQPRRLLPLRG